MVIMGLFAFWVCYKIGTTSRIKVGTEWELYENIYDSYSLRCVSSGDVNPFQVNAIMASEEYIFIKTVGESSYLEDIVYCSPNKCVMEDVLKNKIFVIREDSIDLNELDFMNPQIFFYLRAIRE